MMISTEETHGKLQEAIRQNMRTPEGRFLLRWMLDISRLYNAEYTPESGALYFVQGQRSVGVEIFKLITSENSNNMAILTEENKNA